MQSFRRILVRGLLLAAALAAAGPASAQAPQSPVAGISGSSTAFQLPRRFQVDLRNDAILLSGTYGAEWTSYLANRTVEWLEVTRRGAPVFRILDLADDAQGIDLLAETLAIMADRFPGLYFEFALSCKTACDRLVQPGPVEEAVKASIYAKITEEIGLHRRSRQALNPAFPSVEPWMQRMAAARGSDGYRQ